MQLTILNPKQSLNKAYLKEKISRSAMDQFKQNFAVFLNHTNANRNDEEHLKSQVAYFLRDTWFKDSHHINPIGKNDLVIHTGKSTADPVGVIIEVKSLTNKAEMLTLDKPNAKALHELVLYYMRQHIEEKNNEIKYLIATNIDDWFIFDANEFDKKIYRNSAIKKLYELKKADNKDNPWFYDELKKLLDNNSDIKLEAAHFRVREFEAVLLNNSLKDDHKLIAIYKLLSPVHLLKLPFANDSNSLQPKFYAELLHLIGLTEIKEGSKKLIQRKKTGERNGGSLIENTISQLESHDKLSRIDKPSQYGETSDDRLFNVALELVITWINRILFLKLLEAQLASYHKGDKTYRFLNKEKIKDFDDLDKLFFSVLAKQPNERREEIQKLFAKVPYLNSSLFEPTELEHQTLFIYGLEDRVPLPALNATVLKDAAGKAFKGSLDTIDYLFAFLDAYDFSSEGAEEIQEDNKTLINASVLGLIFEKINGYKDGSFFTPGFITMYMCRETIRRAVLQKFNEAKGWDCKEYGELYDKIENSKEANSIINSLKICDPAVGSGHFLVSALNEIIAIKSDLRILLDRDGRRLKEYQAEIVNDELVVTDDDGQLFEYSPNSKESQRVQEALFHEKQGIIENCLFGVDINPNSVKICRLRLWIELLKNAYYRVEGVGHTAEKVSQLETLPNIDINIKTGNSLISRFALDADLKQALKKSGQSIEVYRIAVQTYRNAKSKEEKREMERLINSIKGNFRTEIGRNDPKKTRLEKLGSELYHRFTGNFLFEPDERYNKKNEKNKEQEKLEAEISKLTAEIEEIKNNKIYENAFEWRFEFPEALNDEGDFVGFDVVIGNPPYMRVRDENQSLKKHFLAYYAAAENQLDLYHLFVERSDLILNALGCGALIIPNSFLANQNTLKLRRYILDQLEVNTIVDLKEDVFIEAAVDVLIFGFSKKIEQKATSCLFKAEKGSFQFLHEFTTDDFSLHPNLNFTISLNAETSLLIEKIRANAVPLNSLFDTISGIKEYQVGKGKPAQISEQVLSKSFNSKSQLNDSYLPELRGKNISKYHFTWNNEYISYGPWLAEPRVPSFFEGDKILIRQIPGKYSLVTAFVSEKFVVDQTAYIAKAKRPLSADLLSYVAILNSKLIYWFFTNVNNEFDTLFPKIKITEFNALPLPRETTLPNALSLAVKEIIRIKQQDVFASTVSLESEIDQLVYQLYGLTEEEIKIVEGVN